LKTYIVVSPRKKPRPAAEFSADLGVVRAHCLADGGDPAAVDILTTVFAEGVSIQELMRRMTRKEARDYNGSSSGQIYRVFLQVNERKRFNCRLCAVGAQGDGWKHAKDALRHLKRDHFGLSEQCNIW
jgi:hypothetical protein